MEWVHVRFVCSNDGQHQERALPSILYRRADDGREDVGLINEGKGASSDNDQDYLEATIGRGQHVRASVSRIPRLLLDCPNCRPQLVLNEDRALAIGRQLAEADGATYKIDVSTGAKMRKQ